MRIGEMIPFFNANSLSLHFSNENHTAARQCTHLILNRRLRVHHHACVVERAVRADKHVAGNGLAEHFDAQRIGNDLLRFAVQVWPSEREEQRDKDEEEKKSGVRRSGADEAIGRASHVH